MDSNTRPRLLIVPGSFTSHVIVIFNTIYPLLKSFDLCILVASRRKVLEQLDSTGLDKTPFDTGTITVETFEDGELEDSDPPMDRLLQFYFGSGVANAVDETLSKLFVKYGRNTFRAFICDTFFSTLYPIARKHNIKLLTIFSPPFVSLRILESATVQDIIDNPDGSIVIPGLVGIDGKEIEFVNTDAVERQLPFIDRGTLEWKGADGCVFGNSGVVLEGAARDESVRLQGSSIPAFFLGPQSPTWFMNAAVDEEARRQHLKLLTLEGKAAVDFLDSHPPASVLFITLGSHGYFTPDQFRQLQSVISRLNITVLLVDRSKDNVAKTTLASDIDPKTFHILSWAPQLDVLVHPAIRCILTHAGWGTVTESLIAGVPMITCPIFSDQPINAKWMHALGVSFGQIAVHSRKVMDPGNPHPIFREDSDKVLGRLIVAAMTAQGQGEYEARRARAQELGRKLRESALDVNGSRNQEIERLITFIEQ